MGDQSTFDFFRQETSHKDVVIRTEAMNRLALVCAVMTPEKVRGDMMPYLLTKMDDLDQVLLAMAKRLGELHDLCGGKDHVSCLLSLFEPLCAVEETVVRTAATTSVCKILSQMDDLCALSTGAAYVAMFKKIAAIPDAEVSFYCKVSAAQMADQIYRVATLEERTPVQEVYFALCKDEMPIVRRAAAVTFPRIAPLVDKSAQAGEFLQILKSLSSPDEHPTVKILAAQCYIEFIQLVNHNEQAETAYEDLINFVKNSVDDASWRIRLAVVKNFGALAVCFSPEVVAAEIFPCFVTLLQDTEADVRGGICASAIEFLEIVGAEAFLADVIPIAWVLSADLTPSVRKALADMSVNVAAFMGPEAVNTTCHDLVEKLLSDEDAAVRLRILEKLGVIAEQVAPLLERITPQLVTLCSDENWRVRQQLNLQMPAILKHMGQPYFQTNFLEHYVKSLKDTVSEVRCAMAFSLCQVVQATDSNWVQDKIYPTVKGMAAEEYFSRITMVSALKHLLDGGVSERFVNEIYALVISSASDTVPNVRLAATGVLHDICRRDSSASIIGELRPVLKELKDDKDKEVRYAATEALKLI